jgi:bcr-type benzoyl-CoA reductase subunit C
MTELAALAALVDEARAPLSGWPDRYPGRPAIGVLCSYVPVEMIHAAGMVPVRVRGTCAPVRHADAHLQSFTCALCRGTLDQLLDGGLQVLNGVVFAHSCDAMQALADLWRMNAGPGYRLDVVMQPGNLTSPAARRFLTTELERFRRRLSEWAGRPVTDDDLRASIAVYDETRRRVQALHGYRDRLTAPEFVAVLDAAQAMPPERLNLLLADLLAVLPAAPSRGARPDGPRLFLTGAVLDEPRVLELIEDLGARVVGDDLCSVSRAFHGQVGLDGDPIDALVDYFLLRPPCPAKYSAGYDPGRALLDQVRRVQATGVVFVLEKFCDPHAFDRALVVPALDRSGIPHLLLEIEQTVSVEALRTRLQAFVEMMQAPRVTRQTARPACP